MPLAITDLKKGTIFQLDKVPYKVIDYAQKVVGRGGSIVNVRIKSLLDGRVLDKTFKGNEQLESADITNLDVQYLYKDAESYFFMDSHTYEQFKLDSRVIGERGGYMKDGDKVLAQLFGGRIINIELPKNLSLKVTYTEKAVKGDTSSAITKNAVLETGITIKVPAFIKIGDDISVDTATGAYRERKKD